MKRKFKYFITLIVVLIVFSSLTLSAYASVFVGPYPSVYLTTEHNVFNIVSANNPFTVYYDFNNSEHPVKYTYSSHSTDVLPGFIETSDNGTPTFKLAESEYKSFNEMVNGVNSYGARFDGYSESNMISIPYLPISVDGYVENVAIFEYIEHGYIFSDSFPRSLELTANSIFLEKSVLNQFRNYSDGYGGITLCYMPGGFKDSITYKYSYVYYTTSNSHYYVEGEIDLSVDNGTLRIPLIHPDMFDELPDSSCRLTDLSIWLQIYNTAPDLGDDYNASFTVYTHYPIIAGDHGLMQEGQYYSNYNVLEDIYIQRCIKFGTVPDSVYDRIYRDAYAAGNASGLNEGFVKGRAEGLNASMTDLAFTDFLGVAVGGFLDFPLFNEHITLGSILAVILAITFVSLFLKFFAGG